MLPGGLDRTMTAIGPILQALAIGHVPNCVPTMYVWPSVGLRLIHA